MLISRVYSSKYMKLCQFSSSDVLQKSQLLLRNVYLSGKWLCISGVDLCCYFFFCRSASLWCPIYNQTAKYPLLPVYRARLTNVAQHKFLLKQLQNITAKCKVLSIAALSVSFRFDCKHVVPRHKKRCMTVSFCLKPGKSLQFLS